MVVCDSSCVKNIFGLCKSNVNVGHNPCIVLPRSINVGLLENVDRPRQYLYCTDFIIYAVYM